MAIDTFGQSSPLMAFHESRPPSSNVAHVDSGNGSARRSNGGLSNATPPQMYTTDAPMATEEFTGTTTMNSSPSKLPTTARSNLTANGTRDTDAMIRKKGLPWVMTAQIVVIFLLLIIIGFLLYKMYGEEQIEFYTSIPPSSTANPLKEQDIDISKADILAWPTPSSRSLQGQFAKAAVLSENGICSEIGRNVLLKGGNAVDAAISVSICVGALNSHSAGIGGGFLMTMYHRFYGKCTTLDARETAPSRTHRDIFNASLEEAKIGYKSVAVPGEVHGFWTAFKRFGSGKIAWMDLLMPTVNLLNEGYPTTKVMEYNLRVFKEFILNGSYPGMRNQFLNPSTGELYKEGEIMRNQLLADTLKRLALSHDPVHLFYSPNGEIARMIVEEFGQNGGFINRKDLHTYRSVVDEQPLLNTEAHDKLVFCGPKPSSGFALSQLILAVMLQLYPPGSNSSIPWNSDEYWHKLVEAQKYAYALRTKLGDANFIKDAEALAQNMTRRQFVESIVEKIGPKASEYKDYGFVGVREVEAFIDEGGTSQIAIIDADGNAVSITHSINNPFGSLVMSPRLGIIWNDHMDDFSTPVTNNSFGFAPSKANFIEPGKRPMSSMSPMIVYDRTTRKVKAAIGGSGGAKIPSAISQVLSQVLSFNHTIKQAIDTVRLHNQFTPFTTFYEKEFPKQFLANLTGRGQNMSAWTFPYSFVLAIIREKAADGNDVLVASNDHRRQVHSYPVGY